ncbi:hypothetical protein Tco_0080241 [Tanacetum coccineum]
MMMMMMVAVSVGWQRGGGDGGVIRRVKESDGGDRIDPVTRSLFGLRRKSPPEKFSGGGGGGRRRVGREEGEGCYKSKHKIFDDREASMYEIGLKCLTEGYEYKVVRSCPNRYAVECVHLECYWYILTPRIKNDIGFKITYINDMLYRMLQGVYIPRIFFNDLNIEYNFDVSYKRAWKAKQLALESNQGCLIASFAQLPYYCYNLKLANENTVTHIDTDNEGRFKMLFIGFGVANMLTYTYSNTKCLA